MSSLGKDLARSMQESDIRIMEESGLKLDVWSIQDPDIVEPWYTQDPTKISMQDSYTVKTDLDIVMYVYIYLCI